MAIQFYQEMEFFSFCYDLISEILEAIFSLIVADAAH